MKKLLYLSAILVFACSSDDSNDDNDNNNNPSNCDVVYLDDNGITIKACDDANIGDVGTINGVEYTVVDRAMLDEMIANDEDLTVVCTTRVTDMHFMFFDNEVFNQPIDNWDVSNVTDMSYMFETAIFNQPIGNWDVSSVTHISYMFSGAQAFNQPIGDWDVSSVTHMSGMFSENISFNQDLSNWSVGNVTKCYGFSSMTPQWTQPQPNFTNCNP